MGKKRRDQQTLEAIRFGKLVNLLLDPGHPELGCMNQSDIARVTGMEVSHINKLTNGTRKGMGTDIIRRMRDKLKIDPAFFFEDKEPTDLKLFILSEERMKRQLSNHEERLAAVEAALAIAPVQSSKPERKTKR